MVSTSSKKLGFPALVLALVLVLTSCAPVPANTTTGQQPAIPASNSSNDVDRKVSPEVAQEALPQTAIRVSPDMEPTQTPIPMSSVLDEIYADPFQSGSGEWKSFIFASYLGTFITALNNGAAKTMRDNNGIDFNSPSTWNDELFGSMQITMNGNTTTMGNLRTSICDSDQTICDGFSEILTRTIAVVPTFPVDMCPALMEKIKTVGKIVQGPATIDQAFRVTLSYTGNLYEFNGDMYTSAQLAFMYLAFCMDSGGYSVVFETEAIATKDVKVVIYPPRTTSVNDLCYGVGLAFDTLVGFIFLPALPTEIEVGIGIAIPVLAK